MASDQPGPSSTILVPTGSNVTVYASTSSLYLLDSNTTAGTPTGIVQTTYGTPNQSVASTSTTTIDQIDLVPQGGNLQLTAQGSVKGVVLDQFSADEAGGYLRIATTEGTPGWSGTPDVQGNSQTHVFVLRQAGKSLEVVAALDNLAPGEEIYSVRFMAAEAFMVTYRRVDPLFAIDLSDPTLPKLAGELDMPGYSDYLQSVGDGFLIGVGRDVGDVEYSDPQVSLFNVSDLANPVLVNRVTIPAGMSGGINVVSDPHVVAKYFRQQSFAC